MADPQAFIREILPYAVEVGDRYGIDPVTIITQAALETGWGEEVAGNNYFGIKSHGQPGGQSVTTHEEINGKRVKVQDHFRTYGSLADSVNDYGRFLTENPRYAQAIAQQGYPEELAGIAGSGYATSSDYPDLVQNVARSVTRRLPPLPPASLPEVGTFLDTVRMPPQPATIAPNLASLRSVTSPSGGNGELQQALNRVATTRANEVTLQIRRPQLPAMGTPDVGALYAGIYDQPERVASASDSARGKAAKPSTIRSLPVKQSSIERGPSRTALAVANLTSPGAIDASVRGAGANTDQALAAALTRRVANLPAAAPSSPIDRGETRVAALPASKPRVTVSTPFTTPQSAIERGAARILEASPIGQPPATRVVQSVPVAPPQSTAAAVLSASDRARAAKAAPAVFRSIPGPVAVAKDETRLLPSAALPPANYGVAETAPVRPPTPLPALARANVPTPAPPYRAVATQLDTTPMPTLPRVRPSLGMGVPAPVAQAAGPAPTPMPRLQRGGIFGKPQILGHDVPLPGLLGAVQSATMAMNNASGPFNNGADNLIYNRLRGGDFNTPGAATAQSAGFLFAPKPGGGWLNVGHVDPKISAADRYASLNSGNGGPRTAADRAGKSLSQSGGARSFME